MAYRVATLNIDWHQGDTFDKVLTWRDSEGDPVPLSGWGAKMEVRRAPGTDVLLECSTDNGRITLGASDGTITFSVAAEDMELPAGTWRYDLELTQGAYRRTLVAGKFRVRPEITES